MRPDVVGEDGEGERDVERDVERDRWRVLADGAVDLAELDAEEERGAEGDGGAAGGGELAQEGHDGGALVGLGAVQGNVAVLVFDEQGRAVVTDQELGGGGIGVVRGSVVQRKAEANVSDVQDVPLLGVQVVNRAAHDMHNEYL